MGNEIYVTCRTQLIAALLAMAGEGPKPGDPFTIYLAGTRFKVHAPKGMNRRSAGARIRNIRRAPAGVFKTPEGLADA